MITREQGMATAPCGMGLEADIKLAPQRAVFCRSRS